ncbi:hypothetical protein B0T09DRAFT_402869 [Sordaria sp. MPI-SDFR-AT-0083]|nr:hypothetical protein B0T09DRAFT_402869 [Sordaria sp. MPI-SDFR-AT-0083]
MGDQHNQGQQGAEGTKPHQPFYQPQPGELNGPGIESGEFSALFDYDAYAMAQNHGQDYAVDNMNVDFGNNEQGFDMNMNMLNMNDGTGQPGFQVQDQNQNLFSNPFADQNQPAQVQCPVLNTASYNNAPAMDSGVPDDDIDPRLRVPQDDGLAAGPDAEGQANVQFPAQQLRFPFAGPQLPPQQGYLNPSVGAVEDNSPAGQDNHPPLEVFMSGPAPSPKSFPTAGLTNPVESSVGSRRKRPLKPGRNKESVVPTESPSKKRKASPSGHNRSQSLVQPQDHNNHNDSNNSAVREKRSATVGSSMNPGGLPVQFKGHLSEPGPRVPPHNFSSGLHRGHHQGHHPVDPRAVLNVTYGTNHPVPILPKPTSRRERLRNALQKIHNNPMTAWRRMPGGMRHDFLKELVLVQDRGVECLTQWEQDLLMKSREEEHQMVMVYREIAKDTDRELRDLMEKHSRLVYDFEEAGRSITWLRQQVLTLGSIAKRNELDMHRMMTRITDLGRSHLRLHHILDERVHILNWKVDRKVRELEEAVEKLKLGKEGSQNEH